MNRDQRRFVSVTLADLYYALIGPGKRTPDEEALISMLTRRHETLVRPGSELSPLDLDLLWNIKAHWTKEAVTSTRGAYELQRLNSRIERFEQILSEAQTVEPAAEALRYSPRRLRSRMLR